MTFADKQALNGKSINPNPQSTIISSGLDSDSEYVTYIVQDGDTIWDIVKKFDSVSTSEVLALNNISDPGKIQVGQKLKIKKKS